MMSQPKSEYNQELKDNAARYCLEKPESISQGARDLKLSKCTMFKWVNEYTARTGEKRPEDINRREKQKQ